MNGRLPRWALVLVACLAIASCSAEGQSRTEENEALIRLAHDAVWSRGDLSAIDQIWAEDFVGHPPIGPDWRGRQALRERVQAHRTTFPDWRENVEEVITAGDRAAARWTSTGTDVGGFRGNPPTGRSVAIQEMGFYRIADGRIVEQWVVADIASLQQQLGIAPERTGP